MSMQSPKLAGKTLLAVILLALAPWSATETAEAKKKPVGGKLVVVGRALSTSGRLARRTAPGKAWKLVEKGGNLYAGDLLVAGYGSALENTKGTVRVGFLGNLDNSSPLPIVETAVLLHPSTDVDLDFTLDRGRVDVVNRKKTGPARVRVRVRDEFAVLTLHEPQARFALEVYGRWPAGVPFVKDPGPAYGPATEILLLVLKGTVDVKGPRTEHHLTAPPGPALIHLDSAIGHDPRPERLDELPAWARSAVGDSTAAMGRKAALARFRALAQEKGIGPALDALAKSDKPAERRLAVFAMGAFDDLDRLARVLTEAKYADLWENGVLAVRHWIGRKPGQDQLLYRTLQERYRLPAAHAETVLQLLHSFGDEELSRPETYELLIDHLNHDRLAIRGLAYWHLSRLAPAGRSIAYNPLGTSEERARAQQQWRKLIPSGEVPPKPKPDQAGRR